MRAIPVKTQSAEENVPALITNWMNIFGWPLAIIHDNHKNFKSTLFSYMTTIFDIDDRAISPFKSSSNGKVESQNKRINTAMRACLTNSQLEDWDIWLPYIVFALNGLKSSKTSFSSNQLVFGKEIRAPRDLWCDKTEFEIDHNAGLNPLISEETLKTLRYFS